MTAESVRPAGLASRNRVAAWIAQFCAEFEWTEIIPSDVERFNAAIETGELGPLRFARLSCIGSSINCSLASGTRSVHSFSLIVQLRGTGTISQYGQEATMQPGDLALCDNSTPHSHFMLEQSELILLRIPARALQGHMSSPEQSCGRRLPGSCATAPATTALLTSLCGSDRGPLPPAVQESLSRQVLELVAISYSLTFGKLIAPSTVVGNRYAKARRFIEQHLRDPELGAQKIARALNVSARYLRWIFAAEKESVSAYILRRRLEEVAHQLTDARWRGRSIGEIAFEWGFNSAPHFSRSFRGRFGLSPREYRARHHGPGGQMGRSQPQLPD